MRPSKVLAKIRAGQVARICCTGSPIAFFPAIAAHFRYDGIWVDAEHRVWEGREVETMLGRHHAADIDCVWRAPTKEKNSLYRLLEDGASGLMIPHVGSAEEARALVNAMKFPPLGDRGFCGGGRDASYWIGKPADYIEQANHETFLVAQIETPASLENIDAIAAVPGVDILFLGPGDMSLRLNCTPGVNDPAMMAVQQKCQRPWCRKHFGPACAKRPGVLQPSGAFAGQETFESARGLAHSKTLPRSRTAHHPRFRTRNCFGVIPVRLRNCCVNAL